jgi:purine-cytosine permease-like protein
MYIRWIGGSLAVLPWSPCEAVSSVTLSASSIRDYGAVLLVQYLTNSKAIYNQNLRKRSTKRRTFRLSWTAAAAAAAFISHLVLPPTQEWDAKPNKEL